jgi:hypothetical protein
MVRDNSSSPTQYGIIISLSWPKLILSLVNHTVNGYYAT